jgi:colanic acid biosynthesis glycosyl transferase WcaI
VNRPFAMSRPRALLAYHFFYPDDVVSARLFGDLARGLHERGWDVTALTSDRVWGHPSHRLPAREVWEGVAIERVARPAWDQRRPSGRLLNSAWLLAAWLARARRLGRFDAVVVGSDPAFAPLLLAPLRRLWPNTAMAHWCFDLYPEAIAADGAIPAVRSLVPIARAAMAHAYRSCDAIVDLGPRMRERLSEYPTKAVRETLVPWALAEGRGRPFAPEPAVRATLFGDANVGLLYSGTLGRAHDFTGFLRLARASRQRSGHTLSFAFAVRGDKQAALSRSVSAEDTNVRIVAFSDEVDLASRLEAADVHMLSLRPEWSGLVVPSKFFGSLAVGRPVLYSGPPDSDVARWIAELQVGWQMDPLDPSSVLDALEQFASSPNDRTALQKRARDAYDAHFRKAVVIDRWDKLLRSLVARRTGPARSVHPVNAT